MTRRGVFGGVCFTLGCTGKAYWMAQGDVKRADALSRYRCEPCCDAISARVDALLLTGERDPAALDELLRPTLDLPVDRLRGINSGNG